MASDKCTLIPEQLFDSQDAFITHVKRFAVENGFNVRLDDVERDKGGVIRKRDIVCSSEGAPRGKDGLRPDESPSHSDDESSDIATLGKSGVAHSGAHRRKSMKTGCRWLARASRQASGMWKIIMLRLEHNHPLATRYELLSSAAYNIRTGDNASISAAALAARAAIENGAYGGPSVEFKNLFLQMTAACADLCWSAARHPETVAEVLSEIRRLNQHLEKHDGLSDEFDVHRGSLATIDEAMDDGPSPAAAASAAMAAGGPGGLDAGSSLVMMAHGGSSAGVAAPSPQQRASHMVETPAQIIAQSQNRIVEPQSPELNGTSNIVAIASGAVPAASSPALPAVSAGPGPVKRARGRPRKNPIGPDGKTTKSKAQQKRDQQREQQQLAQMQAIPTPASLASLSQRIIVQNAASSPVNAHRPINSSLALPSQPMQGHAHAAGRTPMIGTDTTIPSMLDTRSHLNPHATAATAGHPHIAESPLLGQPPGFPTYQSHPGYHYHQPRHYEQQHQQPYRQPSDAAGPAGSHAAMGQLMFPAGSSVPAGYHSQLSRVQGQSATAGAPGEPAGQRQMFHLNPTMQTAHISRSPAAQINSYFLMSRTQPQPQQPQPPQPQPQKYQYKQPTDHLVGMAHQSPGTVAALPPMSQNHPMLPEPSRRLDELQLNPYHGMGNWQM
ncbi:hypothetical protein LPJ61_002996 [Coemansia biformis]|uniref:FAR1 domain-containing protein n=1 Tax=Coemansia biformis TaxID=1286918 RepID=A0A9W7YEP7_9FUNG|nr:hypothetical protein LPJ61_002996 [Coemansia biformis]